MVDGVVLGLGGTIDHELCWDVSVIRALAASWDVEMSEFATDQAITSTRDLLVNLVGFLNRGTGGERYVANPSVLVDFTRRFRYRATLGGTATRAAIGLDRLGYESTVYLLNRRDGVAEMLPSKAASVADETNAASNPHMIVQYPRGAELAVRGGTVLAPAANRIIYVNNPSLETARLGHRLGEALASAGFFLVSGLNAVRDAAILQDRLAALRKQMARLPKGAVVMLEDGGYHVPAMGVMVTNQLADLLNIFSMNEDEFCERSGGGLDLDDPGQVIAALERIQQQTAVPLLVLHTKSWSLAWGVDNERFETPLRWGMGLATTRYLLGDEYTEADFRDTLGRPLSPVGARFAQAFNKNSGRRGHCYAAAVASPARATTVGLGDTFVGGFVAGMRDAAVI